MTRILEFTTRVWSSKEPNLCLTAHAYFYLFFKERNQLQYASRFVDYDRILTNEAIVFQAIFSSMLLLVSGLGRGRVRNLVPDPTPVHNPYPSDSGRVSARVWVGSQGKNLIYSI